LPGSKGRTSQILRKYRGWWIKTKWHLLMSSKTICQTSSPPGGLPPLYHCLIAARTECLVVLWKEETVCECVMTILPLAPPFSRDAPSRQSTLDAISRSSRSQRYPVLALRSLYTLAYEAGGDIARSMGDLSELQMDSFPLRPPFPISSCRELTIWMGPKMDRHTRNRKSEAHDSTAGPVLGRSE
jgi:hypothetical protein